MTSLNTTTANISSTAALARLSTLWSATSGSARFAATQRAAVREQSEAHAALARARASASPTRYIRVASAEAQLAGATDLVDQLRTADATRHTAV